MDIFGHLRLRGTLVFCPLVYSLRALGLSDHVKVKQVCA